MLRDDVEILAVSVKSAWRETVVLDQINCEK
jgi:hypothetical protein